MRNHVNFLLGCVAGLISLSALFLLRSNKKISETTWENLLALIKPTRMEGIALVAIEYLNPSHSALSTEPKDRFNMLGGTDGLRLMISNANVLLALASHAERWNEEESKYVAALMRQDGLALRQAVRRIRIRNLFTMGTVSSSVYVQIAASKYYQMSGRLLELYRQIPSSDVSSLDSALWW